MEIILTIGVKNYALTLVQKKKITQYQFDDIKKSKIEEIFKKHKNASISIILDNIAQNYQKKKFIAPSSIKIEDLVEQELKIQYDNKSFKGAMNLGESSDRLNHREYLLVDIKREEIVEDALKFLSGLPNKIKKICALS
jgi:methionine synthase II (cobalamin-independent)